MIFMKDYSFAENSYYSDEKYLEKVKERIQQVLNEYATVGTISAKNEIRCTKGYSYDELYDWDSYFESIFLSYFGVSKYCQNIVDAFLRTQFECGFISRCYGLKLNTPREHFKPFLAQLALLAAKQNNDYRYLEGKAFDRLVKYLDYWTWYCDYDKNGLAVWDSAYHSGMDNQFMRMGYENTATTEGVDLNCYLVREFKAMSFIANKINRLKDKEIFDKKAEEMTKKINEVFWDEEDGFYYDRNERTGKHIKVKSIAGFIPLWAGIASKEQAKTIIEKHLLDKEKFWLEYPVATLSKQEEGFHQETFGRFCNWCGPTWIPTNYMVFHGLLNYGYHKEAKELAEKTCDMTMREQFTREYYLSDSGIGQGLSPFWGWSSLSYLMPLELELSYDPTDIELENINPIASDCMGLTPPINL